VSADEPTAARDPLRHLGAIRRLLELILLTLLVIGLYFAKEVVLPLLMGGILALTLSPTVRTLQRMGIAPPVTAVALILSLGLVVGGGAFVASGPVSAWVDQAPQLGARLKAKFVALTSSVDAMRSATAQVDNLASPTADGSVQRVSIQSPGLLNSAVSNAASVLSTILVMLVLALFLLASGDMFYVKLIETFPKFGDKKRALRIVYGIERSISRYLLTVTLINAGLGLVVGIAMGLTGMPQALVWRRRPSCSTSCPM
jgi:predicted PurR-regulated permease PerM